jgi:hypothetical protein
MAKGEYITYTQFEELPVWQESIKLAEDVYDMTESKGLGRESQFMGSTGEDDAFRF